MSNILDNIKMFNLNKFRHIKDNSYNTKNECNKHASSWKNPNLKNKPTNPRFKLFDQQYFTAGDFKDINKYALLPVRYFDTHIIKPKIKDIYIKTYKNDYSKLYENIDYTSIENTFKYIFYKFKKGIFVMIRNNKLVVYMPFSNNSYKNNWYNKIYFSKEEKELLETSNYNRIKSTLIKNINDFQNKYPEQFKARKIDYNREKWYANNCVFRNQFPNYEGELNTNVYRDMIEELLKNKTIPDIEFFINDRDFPILKNDFTEPYHHLFDSETIKVEPEYQFNKMAPLFSQSKMDTFTDLLIPTNDEWRMASNKFFTSGCGDEYKKESRDKWNYNWKTKIAKCIFRGGATGCGISIDNNMRLKASDISMDHPDILDVGIVDWKARMRKVKGEPIQIIDTNKLRFKLANKINNIEKSNYKYILYIDGYVSAYRLASELSMNSCVLMVDSPYKMWFSNLLVPYKHYIPIKSDLEDLVSQLKWCIANDKKCETIAKNARKFYEKYIVKDGLFNYLQSIFNKIYLNKNLEVTIKPNNKSKINIALITIFRDNTNNGERTRELKLFIKLMNKLLERYCKFHIYIIEQTDDGELFNIGKLKNIGFDIATKDKTNYDNYIFSDIDAIPDNDLIEYYIKKLEYPIALALRGTRYINENMINNKNTRYSQKIFFGTLMGFNEKLFKKINGYPNNFWGWGGEDEALKQRMVENKMTTFYYPKKGSVIDMEETKEMKTINSAKNKVDLVKKEEIKYEKLHEDNKSWNKNGLNNLTYKIVKTTKINDNTTQIKVDLLKKQDEQNNPNLYYFNNTNYKLLASKFQNTISKLKFEFI